MNTAEDHTIPISRGDKGGEIVRCLGYRHFHQDDNVDVDGVIGDIIRALGAQNNADRSNDAELVDQVDLWHLRSLAIQPGGLLLSFGRKSGWIKLAGVDELVFNDKLQQQQEEERTNTSSSLSSDRTYDEIQRQLGQEMEPSLWHIQRERRRLRKNERRSYPSNFSSTLSHASSMTDLSSYSGGGSTNGNGTSGSSTPLTCNLNSRSGTPKSVSFGTSEKMSVPAGAPFTAFATKNFRDMSSVSSASFHNRFINTSKENEENGSTIDPSPLHSPFTMPSPAMLNLPQSVTHCNNNGGILKPNNPYIPYQNNTQVHHKQFKARAKKDKRPKERKLLIQIASSAFYLIEQKGECSDGTAVAKLSYYSGMQDLIAILLLHLESPSLASLLFRQIIESHLSMFCIEFEEEANKAEEVKMGIQRSNSEASFHSCVDESDSEEEEVEDDVEIVTKYPESNSLNKSWDLLSLSFFPVLKLVDEELYSSLTANGLLNNRIFVFAEVLKKWISSWFCSQEDLPLEVVSRIIDFFLASHTSMPLYLSIAFVCHPVNRDKFLLPSLEPSPTAFSEQNIFNQTSEDEAESSNDEAELLQPAQSSPRKSSSPRDRQLSKMLHNLFTDLTEELSTVNLPNPFTSEVDNFSLDEKSCAENIISFVEEAIGSATSFMKQVPPSTLNALVNDYNDGFLLNYLDPREHARSFNPLPWALRATAPTDHNLAQKVETEIDSSKAFTLPKYLNEKHQIAVDASGLEVNQQYYDFGWVKIRRTKMTLLVVFALASDSASELQYSIKRHSMIYQPYLQGDVTHTNKAPADIDAKKKQALLTS
ncbi:TBC domain-containing protein [Skeletonema marinoi]|uniref:TBC domain-containing protein n=1 Tax=Skeletonema marinoi TaxID=267567 RepID=A0AAD8Y913_9STRA|nr:TBC domain-containing protein [Skeletonema marinoi]